MANKPEIKQTNKQTKTRIVEKKRKREKNKTTTFLKRKRRQEMSASNETKAGYT